MTASSQAPSSNQDRPALDDVLQTVQAFLDEVTSKLSGESKYHAQVSSYLLSIGVRELHQGPAAAAKERAELAQVLGHDDTLEELRIEASAAIRAGRLDNRWDEMVDLVLGHITAKAAIVRPDHLAKQHRPT